MLSRTKYSNCYSQKESYWSSSDKTNQIILCTYSYKSQCPYMEVTYYWAHTGTWPGAWCEVWCSLSVLHRMYTSGKLRYSHICMSPALACVEREGGRKEPCHISWILMWRKTSLQVDLAIFCKYNFEDFWKCFRFPNIYNIANESILAWHGVDWSGQLMTKLSQICCSCQAITNFLPKLWH